MTGRDVGGLYLKPSYYQVQFDVDNLRFACVKVGHVGV